MNKKHLFTAFLIFNLILSMHSQSVRNSELPNILCILVDDLGYGDLSIQGASDMQTPHIDKLAQNGLQFKNFYANSTVCSPSRASLLSGKYPDMVGVPGVIRQNKENNWGYLSKNSVFISEVLKKQGYHTGIIGKWHLGLERPNTPNDKGFDFFKGFLGDMMDDYWTHRRGGINWMRHNQQEIDPEGHATDIFTDWTIDYLKERSTKKKPFFLYLAYNAPHFPIQPPIKWLDRVNERSPNLPEKRAKNVAFIEHLDNNIGQIMNILRETGLEENTLVVFTSDNGGALRYAQSNGLLRGGKQDMYEGGIKVPAFFYWKNKITPGTSTDNFGMLMDLFPTFCQITGIKPTEPIDGISLLPTILDKPQTTNDRTVYWVRREGGSYGGQTYYAARNGDYKILQNTPFESYQYFNIGKDPYEVNELNTKGDKNYNSLRVQLRNHIQQAGSIPWQKSE